MRFVVAESRKKRRSLAVICWARVGAANNSNVERVINSRGLDIVVTPPEVRSAAFRRKFVESPERDATNFRLKAVLRTGLLRIIFLELSIQRLSANPKHLGRS